MNPLDPHLQIGVSPQPYTHLLEPLQFHAILDGGALLRDTHDKGHTPMVCPHSGRAHIAAKEAGRQAGRQGWVQIGFVDGQCTQ